MKSMTGYAFLERPLGDMQVSIEIKSYNARFLDITVHATETDSASFSMQIRDFFLHQGGRGKIEVTVKLCKKNSRIKITPNLDLAQEYHTAINAIYNTLTPAALPKEKMLELILSQNKVLQTEQASAAAEFSIIRPLLDEAFLIFDNSRKKEGQALYADISGMIQNIKRSLVVIKSHADTFEHTFKEHLEKKITALTGNLCDEARVLQETALMVVKYTINEEIVRLEAHLDSLITEINHPNCSGKKIDFIVQEINREVNTIGSKSQIIEIAESVINIKHSLENIREQARNVE